LSKDGVDEIDITTVQVRVWTNVNANLWRESQMKYWRRISRQPWHIQSFQRQKGFLSKTNKTDPTTGF